MSEHQSSDVPFDAQNALERFMGDEELFWYTVQLVRELLPAQLASLQSSIQNGDLHTACREAHSIKGAISNIGGLEMMACARRIEEAARSADSAILPEYYQRLVAAWRRLEPLLVSDDCFARLSTMAQGRNQPAGSTAIEP